MPLPFFLKKKQATQAGSLSKTKTKSSDKNEKIDKPKKFMKYSSQPNSTDQIISERNDSKIPRTRSMIIHDVIERHSSSLEEMMEKHFHVFFNRLKTRDISMVHPETAAPLSRMATRLRWLLHDDQKWFFQRRIEKKKRRSQRARVRYNDYQYLASIKHQRAVPFPYPQPLPAWAINKPRREHDEQCWACGRMGIYEKNDEDGNESFNELEGATTILEDKLELEDAFYKNMNL